MTVSSRKKSVARAAVLAVLGVALAGRSGEASVDMRRLGGGEALSAPQPGEPLQLAKDFIATHLGELGVSAEDAADLHLQSSSTSAVNGVTHIYLRQRHAGLEVVDAHLYVHVAADGRILSATTSLVAGLSGQTVATTPVLGPDEAVLAAANALRLAPPDVLTPLRTPGGVAREVVLAGGSLSREAIPVKLVYQRDAAGKLRLAWDLSIDSTADEHWWSVRVDAVDGSVVDVADWTAYDQYKVYAFPAESPNHVAPTPPGDGRTVLANPADATASPSGWTTTAVSNGNNVDAYHDRTNANQPVGGDAARANGGPGQNFSFIYDWAQAPTQASNQQAAIANLFYLNNAMHDILWHNGFDEPSGNFQLDNFGRGGTGGDYVRAEAQDGGGSNNANFSTPADGSRPRMQMYLWDPAPTKTVKVTSPVNTAYTGVPAGFGPAPLPAPQADVNLVMVSDGTPSPTLGCNALVNGAAVLNNVAVVDRGSCPFSQKVLSAQNAGAVAVVVMNNLPGDGAFAMGGTCGTCTIPAVMISYEDGQLLRVMIPGARGRVENPAGASPALDGDFDGGIVAHELAHGVSNRLVGGRMNVNCLQNCEQQGEGWSDLLALIFTMEPGDKGSDVRGIGTFALGQPTTGGGIRNYPYSTNTTISPYMYSDTQGTCQAHSTGEKWCAIVWEVVWAFTDKYGFDPDLIAGAGGNRRALGYVLEGMKFTPCSPTFCQSRDGILEAIPNCDGNLLPGVPRSDDCVLAWQAFAKRGLGFDADCGSGTSNSDNTDGTTVPPGAEPVCGNDRIDLGETCDDGNTVGGDGCSATCQVDTCAIGSLSKVMQVKAVKLLPAGAVFSWPAAGSPAAYHLNSIGLKTQLTNPRRSPGNGIAECDSATPSCSDGNAIADLRKMLYYQVLTACGTTGATEGPF